jgi:hypothetical protein
VKILKAQNVRDSESLKQEIAPKDQKPKHLKNQNKVNQIKLHKEPIKKPKKTPSRHAKQSKIPNSIKNKLTSPLNGKKLKSNKNNDRK